MHLFAPEPLQHCQIGLVVGEEQRNAEFGRVVAESLELQEAAVGLFGLVTSNGYSDNKPLSNGNILQVFVDDPR